MYDEAAVEKWHERRKQRRNIIASNKLCNRRREASVSIISSSLLKKKGKWQRSLSHIICKRRQWRRHGLAMKENIILSWKLSISLSIYISNLPMKMKISYHISASLSMKSESNICESRRRENVRRHESQHIYIVKWRDICNNNLKKARDLYICLSSCARMHIMAAWRRRRRKAAISWREKCKA